MVPNISDNSLHIRIQTQLLQHKLFREKLLAGLPDLDEETLADTLEGITDLNEMLGELVRSALLDEAYAKGLSGRISDMRKLLDRLETRASKKRELVRGTMADAHIKKLIQEDFSAFIRESSTSLEVFSEDAIPPPYWIPQPPRLDRVSLLRDLRAGQSIEGARLAAPKVQLSVRTK
jgi:hypothetical protein